MLLFSMLSLYPALGHLSSLVSETFFDAIPPCGHALPRSHDVRSTLTGAQAPTLVCADPEAGSSILHFARVLDQGEHEVRIGEGASEKRFLVFHVFIIPCSEGLVKPWGIIY